ncbi:MAG: glutamate--cysteine ligase, partial [Alphaproteobacteria bacterium]
MADIKPVIESKAELVEWIAKGNKPKDQWRIGTEHEKFGFYTADNTPIPYETAPGKKGGVRDILEGLTRFGWEPFHEAGNIIGLKQKGASITLEPGGQFELSGAPLENLHQTCDEVHTHLAQVREVADELGIGFLGAGFSPIWTRDETPIMPKGRYGIMREYMPKKGTMGLDMMFRSCTVQVNLDFSSEADMVKKMQVAVALQPIATALFANSPFKEGAVNGFQSYRSHVWTDTDNDRCGMIPFVFDDNFGFERWADYALDVPMYFLYRDGVYNDVTGQSFRDFMAGNLKGHEGVLPTEDDWEAHLTTLFPEARVKRFIEMRGADGGPWNRLCALPALWVGLLYDQATLDKAHDMISNWSVAEISQMRDDVPKAGLQAAFRSGT